MTNLDGSSQEGGQDGEVEAVDPDHVSLVEDLDNLLGPIVDLFAQITSRVALCDRRIA